VRQRHRGKRECFTLTRVLLLVRIVSPAAARLKWLGNSAYTLAVLLRLPGLKAQWLTLDIDGKTVEREGVFVEVANWSYTGTTFLIAPKARLDDGSHIRHPQVEDLQARSIAVVEPVPGQLVPDGEILGSSPARFECLPGAVRFLWP
jgi:diacylglycerol kinase family enzyme